ncbi:TetR/AcrR family transcriptional regulator [Actinocorallia sp. A-T 12471]|uniref:TetR/AcrR family transcriptional regulator n=1 Tax=Actinocorallia sp. A-T 12471 TaxID=3089813 RepID=UPI0029CD0812|nr:TetR/AcrR family transcriptional regulator [Actinocorallia sp. A-T 12471]MDX6744030.1 TetR/AcrR family transcriptional regulator [Actinocorallia sp. A-T 12471]
MDRVGSAGTKGVPRAAREEQILEVASAEIARVGYAGLSPATVAAGAGVSKPLVYAYFGSKDALYTLCVKRSSDALGDAIDEVAATIGGHASSLVRAERTLTAVFTTLELRPYAWRVVFDASHPEEGQAADAARAARRRIAEQAEFGVGAFLEGRGMTDPGDVSALTAVWMGVVSSLVDWWLRHPEESAAAMTERSRRLLTVLS